MVAGGTNESPPSEQNLAVCVGVVQALMRRFVCVSCCYVALQGGKFVLTVKGEDVGQLDQWWLHAVLAAIGETLEVKSYLAPFVVALWGVVGPHVFEPPPRAKRYRKPREPRLQAFNGKHCRP